MTSQAKIRCNPDFPHDIHFSHRWHIFLREKKTHFFIHTSMMCVGLLILMLWGGAWAVSFNYAWIVVCHRCRSSVWGNRIDGILDSWCVIGRSGFSEGQGVLESEWESDEERYRFWNIDCFCCGEQDIEWWFYGINEGDEWLSWTYRLESHLFLSRSVLVRVVEHFEWSGYVVQSQDMVSLLKIRSHALMANNAQWYDCRETWRSSL